MLAALCLQAKTRVLRSLTASDGLTNLTVSAFYKDSLGFVWIGTSGSVERFDGVYLKHYPITGSDERLKYVETIAGTAGGQLWVGTGTGLWRLNRQEDVLERVVPDVINCPVRSLLYDGRETLYIGTDHGLYIYRAGKFRHIQLGTNSISPSNAVVCMALEETERLWMATSDGLCVMNLKDDSLQRWHNEMEGEHACQFTCTVRIGDKLYLGTMDRGIVCFDIVTKRFTSYVDVGCNVIKVLRSDGKHTLYVGTDGNGVHVIDTTDDTILYSMKHEAGNNESLRSNSVYSLMVDREGIVWVGFYQAGLDYTLFQGDTFSVYAYPPYFNSKDMPIRAFFIYGDEKLIGARSGLFYINEAKGTFKKFDMPQMRSDMVFCIYRFEDNYLIGTYGGGMYVIDPVTLRMTDFSQAEPFRTGHIFCMAEDAEHTLWIGTSMGLYRYHDGKLLARYTSADSKLPSGNVYEVFFDSTGKGWICTENGLCLWDPSSRQLRTDVFPEGFIHGEKIRVIYEDSAHRLYFFPDKGALFFSDLSMHHFHRIQPGTPLEGRDGLFIIEDADKKLWIGTNNGLFHYDKQENFEFYDFADGIPSPTFTLCPPVCDAEGNLWFGNTEGLLFLDMRRFGEQQSVDSYPVRITDVLVNGGEHPEIHSCQTTKAMAQIQLKASEKNVTFRMSDFSYTSPDVMTYEYKLDGYDESWRLLTGKSTITYFNLPSGTYVFRVRRMGQPASETLLTIDIASRFSPAMAWCVCLLALLSSGCYYYYRKRRHAGAKTIPEVVEPALLAHASVTEHVTEEEPEPSLSESKYKTNKVSPEECKRLLERLERLMDKDKPYKNPNLKIADLAVAIGTSPHALSYVFNQHLERNYYDYVNDYRIAEFKRLAQMDKYARYTLSALSELCGFSSRASFFRSFKKATGITPSEYIHSLGK